MKRTLALALVFLGVVASLSSCKKEPFLTVTGSRSFSFSRDGDTQYFSFSCNYDWSVSSSESWVSVNPTSGSSAEEGTTISITVSPNSTYDPRTAVLTLTVEDLRETITVTQEAGLGLFVSPKEIEMPYNGGTAVISVETNVDVTAKVLNDVTWVSVSKNPQSKGLEKTSYTVSVSENDAEQRQALLSFSYGGVEEIVRVSQSKMPLTIFTTNFEADCLDGATVSIQFTAEEDWTVKETGSSILSFSKESGGPGSETVTVTINSANCTNSDRTISLLFECGGISKPLGINQVPAFRFDSLDYTTPASGGSYQFQFYYSREYQSGAIHTDYDDGFFNMVRYTGEDSTAGAMGLGTIVPDANPAQIRMTMTETIKPNYSRDARTGSFRLWFEENGQTLVSEWIHVTQLGDECAGDATDGITTILQQHSKGSGVPVVILGDGFTKSDIIDGVFDEAATKAFNYLFTIEPYTSLKEYFDVWSISVLSSSRSFNGYGTRFGSRITTGTKIEGNVDLAYRLACKVVPSDKLDDMMVIVVMNMTEYAGTCYMFSYTYYSGEREMSYSIAFTPMTSRNETTFEDIIHHEVSGHGIGLLGDEYGGSYAMPSSESENLLAFQKAGAYVNVDIHADVGATSWARYAADERFSYEKLGAYEGAYTYSRGVYRPTDTSIMKDNKGIFNAPSRAQIYRRVMSIANNWDWTFDYETFADFDAPFRNSYYNRSSTSAKEAYHVVRDAFVPLAPPVIVEVKP